MNAINEFRRIVNVMFSFWIWRNACNASLFSVQCGLFAQFYWIVVVVDLEKKNIRFSQIFRWLLLPKLVDFMSFVENWWRFGKWPFLTALPEFHSGEEFHIELGIHCSEFKSTSTTYSESKHRFQYTRDSVRQRTVERREREGRQSNEKEENRAIELNCSLNQRKWLRQIQKQ